jgi:ABC-type uncharacterized transport system auxiliary subunit
MAVRDSERIQITSADGSYVNLSDAQWSDALPKVLQVKLVRSRGGHCAGNLRTGGPDFGGMDGQCTNSLKHQTSM